MSNSKHDPSARSIRSLGRLPLAFVTLVFGSAALAQQAPSDALYRCVVQGDPSSCPARAVTSAPYIEVRELPGPYALYQIHLGHDADSAVKAAATIGESPVRQTVRVTARQLTPLEKYERYQGLRLAPDYDREVISRVAVDTTGASRR